MAVPSSSDFGSPLSRGRTGGITAAEADALFAGLERARGVVLAVSGGPDSTALLWLAARWRRGRESRPPLLAVTVDHGLRRESAAEAAVVAALAKQCGVAHRIMHWSGTKPSSGLQEAARAARYRLLTQAARGFGASHVVTAHTQDDQAETLIIRMARGSGIGGLAGMARESDMPVDEPADVVLLRPLLDIPKARLIATLREAGVSFADDPSNRDPRFTRVRVRGLAPALACEGLDSARLARLAKRLRRADAAIESVLDEAWGRHAQVHVNASYPCVTFGSAFAKLPAEIQLRLLGRAIGRVGTEGPVELAKLEALHAHVLTVMAAKSRLRRTLAGAVVTISPEHVTVEPAPPRRAACNRKHGEGLNQTRTLLPQSGQTALE